MSLFHKDKKVDKGIKKIDAIITGLVLGGIVASVYGIKKHEEEKQHKVLEENKNVEGKMPAKTMVKGLIFGFKDKEKPVVEKKPGHIRIILTGIFRLIKRLGKK